VHILKNILEYNYVKVDNGTYLARKIREAEFCSETQ
jgi:hypothetical protein